MAININDLEIIKPVSPGDMVLNLLEEKGWNQTDLVEVTGLNPKTINKVIKNTQPISCKLAVIFGAALGEEPMSFLHWQLQYSLAKSKKDFEFIKIKAFCMKYFNIRHLVLNGIWHEIPKNKKDFFQMVSNSFGIQDLTHENYQTEIASFFELNQLKQNGNTN